MAATTAEIQALVAAFETTKAAAETAIQAVNNGLALIASDQAVVDGLNTKLTAATATVTTDQTAQTPLNAAAVAALQAEVAAENALIAALGA